MRQGLEGGSRILLAGHAWWGEQEKPD
jgi:hypothetical protein